ncbi:MAG TPA: hypothetical protein VE954_21830 [Oligoflexus sp.]|uniref:hypothetical protein n=1 Tax=Oligoflexus sp. TaxID=1971216 RepID=UPI002D729DF2|nr:hypothetical protein [Oligoflexus sp.]HYX35746.1 hypothetical protein [Oligoflexus sp.]
MTKTRNEWLQFPVISHGAEYLVLGYLMRRNILAYKAPPNNDGYDIICIHPDASKSKRQIRIQVKSRLKNGVRGFPLKEEKLYAFDYLIFVRLNVGKIVKRENARSFDGPSDVELYVIPAKIIRKNHDATTSWQKVVFSAEDFKHFDKYKGDRGIEQIAKDLRVASLSKATDGAA